MKSKIISVKKLTKIFGKNRAVDNISFNVRENEIFGLLGPNGCGKTTTLRMISTILRPTSGQIEIMGKDIKENPNEIRKKIGYIPQKDSLYLNVTVRENLEFFGLFYGLKNSSLENQIDKVLDLLKIAEKKDALARTLSGGYLKRLSIGIGLVHKPKILICDEITVGLDPVLRHKIWKLIKDLKRETTIIFTTHYLEEAEELCDRVALMSGSKILCVGKPKEISNNFKAKNLNHVFAKLATQEEDD